MSQIVPENPVIADYVKRVTTRPSAVKVAAMVPNGLLNTSVPRRKSTYDLSAISL
jgi:hypothetical protein